MISWKDWESEKLKTALELYNTEIRQKKALIITDWRKWWKEVSSRIHELRILKPETEIMKETPWSRIWRQSSVNKEFQEIVGNGMPTGSVLKQTIAVSVTILTSVQSWHSRIGLRALPRGRMSGMRREPEVPEAGVPVVECLDGPARITSKELAPVHQNACSASPRVLQMWEEDLLCASPGWRTAQQKVQKEWWQKCSGYLEERMSIILEWRDLLYTTHQRHDNWVVHPRTWSHRSFHRFYGRAQTYGNQSDVHADIQDQNLSFGMICPGELHQRNPNAFQSLRIGLRKREWQEKGARGSWPKVFLNYRSKKEQRSSHLRKKGAYLPASKFKLEEREFVVDSGASMHMSKKDLSSVEMDTLTKSCSLTIVITANGEVQTHEEAIVYVKELYIFLNMKVLENMSGVLSLGKVCDENGYSYEWINGQTPHLIKDGIRIICNTEKFVPIVVLGLSTSSSSGSHLQWHF